MHWIGKNVALLVALVAFALGGSALGLALTNDAGHHDKGHYAAMMKKHHGGDAYPQRGRMADDAMHRGGMYERGMHHGNTPGGEGRHESGGAMDHAQHAADLARALAKEGVEVTPAQLEQAMEATHERGMGSSSAHHPGTPPRSAEMP